MAIVCPNPSHPLWNKMVAERGLHAAYATFMHMGNELSYTGSKWNNPLKYKVERDYNLVKFVTENGTAKTKTRGFDRNSMSKIVSQIRDNFVGDYKIHRRSPDLPGEFSIEIEGYPIPKDDEYLNKSAAEIQAQLYEDEIRERYESSNEVLYPHDPDQQDYFRDNYIGYEQRPDLIENLTEYTTVNNVINYVNNTEVPFQPIERKELDRQKDFLLEKFPNVTEVIEDYNMPVLGRLESNGTIIRINPERMKNDTLFHEFGHLFIDLLGGMQNSNISAAYNELIGSDIYNNVANRYKELIGTDRFQKEVVAEALGREAESIWNDSDKRSKIVQLLYNILNALKNMLGISRSEIKNLANTMVKGEPVRLDNTISEASKYIQEQREEVDPNDPSTIVDAIKTLSNEITFNETEHRYFLGDTELTPVSSIMNKAGYGIKPGEETDAVKEGQKLGTVIHKNAESISNGIREIVQVDSGYEMSKKAHEDLKGILENIFGDKYTLLNEAILADAEARVAGTADVIAIDENNNLTIFDFKTKRKEKGFKYYDSTRFGRSQRDINSLQLSLYKKILKRSLNIDVNSLNVVMLNADVNKYNKIMGMSVDQTYSQNGVVGLQYNPLASELLRKEIDSYKEQEELPNLEDIEEGSVEAENVELSNRVEDKYNRIYEESLNVLRQRLEDLKSLNNPAEAARLEEAIDEMIEAATTPKRGIAIFANEAVKQISKLFEIYQHRKIREEAGEENVWTPKLLMQWYEYLSLYDNLEDISSLLLSEGVGLPKSQTKKHKRIIDGAVQAKNFLKNLYKEKGGKILAESHYNLITRVLKEHEEKAKREWTESNKDRIKEMSKKEVDSERNAYAKEYMDKNLPELYENTRLRFEQELLKANNDIGFMARWLDTVLNTDDMVTAAMVKNFVVNIGTARERAIEKRQEMIQVLRELESFMGYSINTPVEKLYDFMLEKNEKGEYTGNILQQFDSRLISEENEMLSSTKNLPADQKRKARKAWRSNNGISIDFATMSSDVIEFAKTLVDSGQLTEEEYTNFTKNEKKDFRDREKRIDRLVNPEAAEEIVKWRQANIRNYYRITGDKWVNPGWKTLSKILKDPEDPRAKFYNLIVEMQQEADSYLPESSRLYGALPAITKSITEAVESGRKITDIVKAEYAKGIRKHSDDIARGSKEGEMPMFFLPTFYQRGEQFDLQDQSYDIATLYNAYYKMALDYRYKDEILGELELAKKFINEREYTVRDSKGNPIKKLLSKAREKELTKDGRTSMLAAQVEDFFQSDIYGKRHVDEGDLNILGLKVDRAKFVDSLSKYSAINMLGVNFVQGLANVTYGELQNITEAMSGEHVSMGDLHEATAYYFNPNNFGDMLGDIGSRSPSSVMGLLNEKFDTLNEYDGGIYRKGTRFSQLMSSNTLFFTSQMGEHFMQTRLMLAMLAKVEAKDSEGNVIGNMRDMYSSVDGKLVLDERVDLEMSNWSQDKQILFGQKVKRVLARIHGEYGNLAKNAIQRSSLGRAALMFRKFMYPGYDKRYGRLKYNEFLEEFTEGSYRQFRRFMNKAIKDLAQLKFALVQEDFKKLLPRERANIARALSEMSFMVSAIILAGIAAKLQGETDDDREKWALSLVTYVSKRTRSELLFYLSPSDAMNILVSPAASISTIENMMGLLSQFTFAPFDRYETGPWKDRLKIEKKAIKLTPVAKQWYRLRDIEQSIGIFDFN